jgi:zinc transport system substrate-binding protein
MRGVIRLMGILTVMLAPVIVPLVHADEPLQVTVSILPQKYFVEKVGGDRVAVTVMVEPGAEPHVYDPRPQQMVALAKAKLYFALGVPFEDAWLPKFAAANPGMQIVHTEAGIQKLTMKAHSHDKAPRQGADKPQAAHEGEHDHTGNDPHIWLSPPLVMIQARNMLNAMIRVDPDHRVLYETNFKKFMEEVVALDLDLLNLFGSAGGDREFMVFHPAWGYFAHAYGLEQTPIESEGKEPKAAALKHHIEHAREHHIRALFVQPQYSSTSARVIAEAIGGQVISADPMAPDWAKNLREVAEKFRAALK